MNNLINEAHYEEQLYQILGTESQVLQLILMPNQQIITNESSIQYMSEKIQLKEKYTLRERFKQVFTGQKKLDFIVDNPSDTIGYIGLTQNSGRIIVLELQVVGQICVQEQHVLAHTNNVDLVICNKFEGSKFLSNKRYFKLVPRAQLAFQFEHFLDDDHDTVKPLAAQFQEKKKSSKELVFIHSHENIIEKDLGKDERMIVHKDVIIGFSESVKMTELPAQQNWFKKTSYIMIQGPGLLYIETGVQHDNLFVQSLTKRDATR